MVGPAPLPFPFIVPHPSMPVLLKRLVLALAVALPFALTATDATAQARTDTETIRSWEEPVKTANGEEVRHVEIAFDYAKGVTLRRTYDASGALVGAEEIGRQPRPSDAELAESAAIIAADAELAPLLAASDATIEGGFLYHVDDFEQPLAACGPGSRCLQFDLVAPDHVESVRFVVVDLATRRVVEHDLFPGL